MRIRRRPQAEALIPSPPPPPPPPPQASDPSTAPPKPSIPPGNQQHWPPRKEEDAGEKRKPEELHPRRPNADLGEEPQWQGGNVVGRSDNAQGRGGAQRQAGAAAAADGHGSLENGHRDKSERPVISAGERLVDGVIQPMPVTSSTVTLKEKEGTKSDGPKRRRGPAVLLEGSRCSRVNGRGWRCSQPTLVGYSLCEHHLGKGRQSRSANGGGGRSTGAPKLGRTEPASGRKSAAAALAVVAAALPDATEPAAHLTADQFY